MYSLTKYLVHGNCLPFCQASQGICSAVVLSLLALTTLTFFPKYEDALCSQAKVQELTFKATIILASLESTERVNKGVTKKLSL